MQDPEASSMNAAASPGNDPDILLKYCDLAQKLGQPERARTRMAQEASRLDNWSAFQLFRLMRIAEKSSDFALAASAFEEVASRDTVSLQLAMYILKLSHTSQDGQLIPQIRSWLEARLDADDVPRFRLQGDHLLLGPDVALANMRAKPKAGRTPNEAADLVEVLFEAGERKLALRYLTYCRRRWPNAFRFVDLLTAALQRFGEPQQALDLLLAAAYPRDTRVLRLQMNILLQSGRLEEAEQLIEDAGAIGKTLLSPLQMMKLKLGRGDIEEAEALGRVVSSGIGRGGNAYSKFRTTHIGALLNEAQLFLRTANAHPESDGEISEELERAYFHPAKLALDRWQSTTAAPRQITSESDIPRHIVQYWNTEIIPDEIEAVMKSWQNVPGYSYRRFDRETAMGFLEERFDKLHLRAFRLANNVAEECDFLRLCLLLADGGIYADADDMWVGDLEQLRDLGRGAILFREPIIGSVSNNVMLARPGHALFQIAVDMARESLLARENDNTWAKTGPGLVARAAAAYISQTPVDEARQNFNLLPDYVASRQVQVHMRLPYKTTPAYWNSKDGANPADLDRVLHRLVGSQPSDGDPASF